MGAGAKDAEGGDVGGGEKTAEDKGLEGGGDGGAGGDDGQGSGVGGAEDGTEALEPHGKAEEVRRCGQDSWLDLVLEAGGVSSSVGSAAGTATLEFCFLPHNFLISPASRGQ